MRRRKLWIELALGSALLVAPLAACERVEEGAHKLRTEAEAAYSTGKAHAARTRDEAQRELAEQLDRLSAEIRALRERSVDPKEEAREALAALATELEAREKIAREKLTALKESGDGLWQRFWDDAERETQRLADACREAASNP